jgi:hypothetical protein
MSSPSLARSLRDRLTDLGVPSAAAEIAGESFFDFVSRGVRFLVQEMAGSHKDAWRANAALGAAAVEYGLLQAVQVGGWREAFDRGDVSSVCLQNRDEATVDEQVVYQDAAGATFAFAASFLGAGQAEVVAQDVEQAFHGINVECSRLAIHRERNLAVGAGIGHGAP